MLASVSQRRCLCSSRRLTLADFSCSKAKAGSASLVRGCIAAVLFDLVSDARSERFVLTVIVGFAEATPEVATLTGRDLLQLLLTTDISYASGVAVADSMSEEDGESEKELHRRDGGN